MGRVKITILKENILRNGPIISDMFPSLLAWMDEKIRCLGEAAIFVKEGNHSSGLFISDIHLHRYSS